MLICKEYKVQRPIYYVSKILRDAETRYLRLKKLSYVLVISARMLRPYFQAHTIILFTDQPLKPILHQSDTSSQLGRWVIKLTEFNIKFQPHPSIKTQILTDFVIECTLFDEALKEDELLKEDPLEEEPTEESWIMHVDRSSSTVGSGASLILTGLEETAIEYAFIFTF